MQLTVRATVQMENEFKKAFKSTAEELKKSGIQASESGTTAVAAVRRGV